RHDTSTADLELGRVADFLAGREVIAAAVYGDRRAVFRPVQRHAYGHTLSGTELFHDRLGNFHEEDAGWIRLRDRCERDRGHKRAGVFTDSAANAGTGRVKPLSVRSPTAVVSASVSTAAWTRWLSRIWPTFASAERRWARITTLPIAP